MTKPIYLDYAAATPMDPQVLEAMQPYFSEQFYNPSATYLAGRNIRQVLNEARSSIAGHLGARPAEIVFTAGATEANNLAIQGIMRSYPDGEVLVSAVEHESVIAPAKAFNYREIPVDQKGRIDLVRLEKMITDKTVLVSIMYVNNELGTIQPLKEVAKILNKLSNSRLQRGNNRPLYFHTDAAQAGNYLDLHVSRLGVDLMSLNGGKIYGPKQSGALYVKAGIKLEPIILGGGQEFGLRSGTENVAGAIGLAAALDIAQKNHVAEAAKITNLKKLLVEQISQTSPGAIFNGLSKHQAPHILSITFPGLDNERLMMQLDELSVICAVGSACSARSGQPSHVLAAIGLNDAAARSTLRFSLGRDTSEAELMSLAKRLKGILSEAIR